MRLKGLPSLKRKKRYLVFKVHSEEKLEYFNVKDAVWSALYKWLGDKGLASADVWLIKNLWSQEKQEGFLRCNHTAVDSVKTGIATIHQIGDQKVIFQVIKVAGTIKSGKENTRKTKNKTPLNS